jgi:hypothetical protein
MKYNDEARSRANPWLKAPLSITASHSLPPPMQYRNRKPSLAFFQEDIDKIADFYCFSKNEYGKIALTPLMGTALLADVASSLTEYDAES